MKFCRIDDFLGGAGESPRKWIDLEQCWSCATDVGILNMLRNKFLRKVSWNDRVDQRHNQLGCLPRGWILFEALRLVNDGSNSTFH